MSDFESFMLDAANRPAAIAARAVAGATGVPFAPLVVAGPPGSGRTALLEAIAARVRQLHPGAAVELLSVDALA
jgi:chromosomal replication initiation ATPase DnaA